MIYSQLRAPCDRCGKDVHCPYDDETGLYVCARCQNPAHHNLFRIDGVLIIADTPGEAIKLLEKRLGKTLGKSNGRPYMSWDVEQNCPAVRVHYRDNRCDRRFDNARFQTVGTDAKGRFIVGSPCSFARVGPKGVLSLMYQGPSVTELQA